MTTKVSFSTTDKIVDQDTPVQQVLVNNKNAYFELEECIRFITENGFSRIALQFPDELMTYSTFVAKSLEENTKKKFYVLADTSYGSCCIDEVAAVHYNADLIIHFGQTCLSNTGKVPVKYVFGQELLYKETLISKMKENFASIDEKILLFYDVQYYHEISKLKNDLFNVFQNLQISNIEAFLDSSDLNQGSVLTKFGRSFKLNFDLHDYKILFVGKSDRTLYNMIVSFNRNAVYSFNPESEVFQREGLAVNKYLMKRFYLIEKAKDANIIGILMGTLGVARYNEMVTRLKTVLKNANKKFYTFIVGKINPAKLANFMEIDLFVMVACPENSLIDSKEFYQPIVTPYEMEIACLKSRNWTGDYVTDFRDLLPGSQHHVDVDQEESNDEEEPEYSLITGKLRSNNNAESISTDIATRSESNSLVATEAKSAGEYLSQRTWKGLQIDPDKTEVKSAVRGRSGIAMNYANEPEK